MSETAIGETISDLRHTIAWMDLALAQLQEGIAVIGDSDMKIRYANDAFAHMTHQRRIFVLGAPLQDFFPMIRAALAALPSTSEHRYPYPDGGRIIEINASGLPFSQKEIILVFRDVTERKATEEELARRRADLERSNADLQQFASFASHDLQEPLRKMSLYSQLLRQQYEGKLDEKAGSIIDTIVGGAGRMQELLKGLQRYCALERDPRAFSEIDVQVLVKVAISDLELSITESGARVSIGQMPVVQADSAQLIQVYENLISNAIKFRSKVAPKIDIGAKKVEGAWLFWVKDNGIGIEKEHSGRIFQLFERLHPLKRYPGSGIGLALCQRIIERHGGRIWVEPNTGGGSSFYFTIPAAH